MTFKSQDGLPCSDLLNLASLIIHKHVLIQYLLRDWLIIVKTRYPEKTRCRLSIYLPISLNYFSPKMKRIIFNNWYLGYLWVRKNQEKWWKKVYRPLIVRQRKKISFKSLSSNYLIYFCSVTSILNLHFGQNVYK